MIYIYQCYSSARCTHLFDLERTTVHDMFVGFLHSLLHELFSSKLNHPIKKKKRLARVAQKRQMINGLNDTYAQPFVSKPARMNKNKTGTRETIRQAPQEINENWLRKNTSDTKLIKNNHIICLCGVQQLHYYIQTQNGWQDQLMTRIHKRPSAPITHSGSISVIPLVESLNKSLTPCLVTEHHLKSNNETVQKNATS